MALMAWPVRVAMVKSSGETSCTACTHAHSHMIRVRRGRGSDGQGSAGGFPQASAPSPSSHTAGPPSPCGPRRPCCPPSLYDRHGTPPARRPRSSLGGDARWQDSGETGDRRFFKKKPNKTTTTTTGEATDLSRRCSSPWPWSRQPSGVLASAWPKSGGDMGFKTRNSEQNICTASEYLCQITDLTKANIKKKLFLSFSFVQTAIDRKMLDPNLSWQATNGL